MIALEKDNRRFDACIDSKFFSKPAAIRVYDYHLMSTIFNADGDVINV